MTRRYFLVPNKLKKKFKTFGRWTLALAILPTVWAGSRELALMLPAVAGEGVKAWWLYALGGASYLAFERFLVRPMPVYVFGHELTHAISGLLSGAKIHSFKVRAHSGEVRLSKSNAFVALSPYIVPIYTIFLIGVFCLVRRFWNEPILLTVFQWAMGVTVAFHLSMTATAVHRKQPDLHLMGTFLSSVLIGLGNVLILSLFCISLFSRTPTVKAYTQAVGTETLRVWIWGSRIIHKEVFVKLKNHSNAKPNAAQGVRWTH